MKGVVGCKGNASGSLTTRWTYVQHRGGPKGFLKVLAPNQIGFADFRGNKQYISLGNIRKDDRVSLILLDYPNRARLKILGHGKLVAKEAKEAQDLVDSDYKGKIERFYVIDIVGFDWNCPQHITPRYTREEWENLAG